MCQEWLLFIVDRHYLCVYVMFNSYNVLIDSVNCLKNASLNDSKFADKWRMCNVDFRCVDRN